MHLIGDERVHGSKENPDHKADIEVEKCGNKCGQVTAGKKDFLSICDSPGKVMGVSVLVRTQVWRFAGCAPHVPHIV